MTLTRLTKCLALALGALGLTAPAAERWGMWETELQGPAVTSPYTEVTVSATFTQGGRSLDMPGFWDGGTTYRLRFSPPTDGEWQYVTRSNRPELDGQRGALTAGAPSRGNRGPVEVFNTHYLRYADGTPYRQLGTTCYAWTHQTEALQEQTLKTLAASPFNKIRFCIFPKAYTYNNNEPPNFAFVKRADGKGFDFDRPDPAFWRHFEQRLLDLQTLGIEADLILWHPYDRWGFSEMSKSQDDRYLRYCIARLSAFRNVWWSLANEYDLMAPGAMKGHRGNKAMADWDRFFQILQSEDPYQRLRSIHNCHGFYDYTRPWVTHASIQSSQLNRGVEFRKHFNKPVIYDECRYEGDVPHGWGNLSARAMSDCFWLGTLSGCYVGHGETYKHPEDILWWSKGGTLHGGSPTRIQWLNAFLADAPPFHELLPLGDTQGRYLLAKPGAYYLLYATDIRPQPLDLAGERPYKVDLVDGWTMTVTPLGTRAPGTAPFTPSRAGAAYRFTPYAAGEPLRPDAAFTAAPAAGRAPLDVRFAAPAGLKARWDFGDGTVSEEPAPTHRYKQPGLYAVTLTVTDAHGGSASSVREITVDHDPAQALLRLGVPDSETHALKLHGSAKRSDTGGFLFSADAPWGWAETGAVEELRGLRAFTLTGWLKPESLAAGQGGNRILFCLNHNRDGIDLVCLADGSLRLAVNQWPDGVSNDSSPGRLVPGKWIRFAVAYDGTRERDNVRWSFSSPLDAPDPAAPLAPDRVTSHAAGPLGADIGPLAVGNFNATLRGAGLDRQFRGEIRGLTLFGSRADASAALPPRRTEVTIRGQSFHLNGRPTYEGRSCNGLKLEGLLMNARLVQATFDDLNPETRGRWAYPDGPWDPDRNTREFLAALPLWRAHGLLAFTLNLQGGSPEGYSKAQPWHNSAFTADGGLRPEFMARLERVLDRADELGMAVILGLFYFGQDERLADEAAVVRGVDNAVDWVLGKGYRNVLIEINNECNVRYDHALLRPDRVHELIERVKSRQRDGRRLLVSTSYGGGTIPKENVVRAADFLLLHGNGVREPDRIRKMVDDTRALPAYRDQPILFNEDDHFDFDKPDNNLLAAVSRYASWGYFDFRMKGEGFDEGFQSVPVNWGLSSARKRGFFGLLKRLTAESEGNRR